LSGEALIKTSEALVERRAETVLSAFLEGRTATTLRAYRTDLADFAAFLTQPSATLAAAQLLESLPGEANRLVLGYRAHLRARGLTPATVNRRLAAIRSLTKLARLLGITSWAIEVPNLPSEAYRDTRGPGRDVIKQMLLASKNAPREHAILHLLYDLGLRRGEVCALDLSDLELSRRTIFVLGKGRLEKIPLTLAAPTALALADWVSVRGTEPGPLFTNRDRAKKGSARLSTQSIYRIVQHYASQLGIRAAPHGLRHTAITEACRAAVTAGIGLEEVLDFSRHKNVSVLMVYRDRERNVQGQLSELITSENLIATES
jgi:integrase/recombinase XerC